MLLSVAVVGLLLLVPIVSMTEAAVIGVNRARIRQMMEEAEGKDRRGRRAARLDKLLEERARLLTAIAVLRTLVTVLGGLAIGAWTMLRHDELLINYVVAMLLVLFLEIVLRRIANARSEPVALAMSGVLSLTLTMTAPLMDFFLWLTRPVTHMAVTPAEEE
ncbi:MAG: CNNM domain-containing protein, partial [Candidatus Xenobia bacterium]